MSENFQKKLPIVMLVLLMLATIIEGISTYYVAQNVVNIGHFILALIVLIIGLYSAYMKF